LADVAFLDARKKFVVCSRTSIRLATNWIGIALGCFSFTIIVSILVLFLVVTSGR
jgi:hypothetical protein